MKIDRKRDSEDTLKGRGATERACELTTIPIEISGDMGADDTPPSPKGPSRVDTEMGGRLKLVKVKTPSL